MKVLNVLQHYFRKFLGKRPSSNKKTPLKSTAKLQYLFRYTVLVAAGILPTFFFPTFVRFFVPRQKTNLTNEGLDRKYRYAAKLLKKCRKDRHGVQELQSTVDRIKDRKTINYFFKAPLNLNRTLCF